MEASKFMHVQQSDAYWHQQPNTSAFKSPDLIELNSDSERNPKKPNQEIEPINYSSSQEEEVETEDDYGDGPEKTLVKEGIGVYDVHSSHHDEESCHLLQTEDDSENSDSENNLGRSSKSSLSNSSNSSAGGATISDNEGTRGDSLNPAGSKKQSSKCSSKDNYWDMTNEQEKYYTEQFTMLQPDVNGLISGSVAKGFFEKSKLPLVELREIWQLSDFTRDGCLNLSEFKMAMHLVVLRRHSLPIPSHFYIRPPLQEFQLVNNNNNNNNNNNTTTSSSSTFHHKQQQLQKANSICISNISNSTAGPQPTSHLVSSQNTSSSTSNNNNNSSSKSRNSSITSTISAITTSNNNSKLNPSTCAIVTAIVPPAPNPKIFSKSVIPVQSKPSTSTTLVSKTRTTEDLHPKRASKEWTTFENEPLNFSSACDISGLVAPVPVRLKTPEDKLISSNINNTISSSSTTTTPAAASTSIVPATPTTSSTITTNTTTNIVREKREVSSASSVSKLQQMGKFQLKAIQRPKLSGHAAKVSTGTIAPPPPPRRKTHIRSSSLDLNRLTITDLRGVGKKLTTQNTLTSSGAAGPEVPARSFLSPSHQGGAFSVYRKPSDSQVSQNSKSQQQSAAEQLPQLPPKKLTQSKVQLQQEVSDLKNENEILNRISSTLLDDLAGLEAKRKALGYKIGQICKKNGYNISKTTTTTTTTTSTTNNSTNLSANHPQKGSLNSNSSQINHTTANPASTSQKGQVS